MNPGCTICRICNEQFSKGPSGSHSRRKLCDKCYNEMRHMANEKRKKLPKIYVSKDLNRRIFINSHKEGLINDN